MKNWECCLHSQGTDVLSGTFPYACPLPIPNIKNEVQKSTLRVLRTLTEPLGNRIDTEVKILLPFLELFQKDILSPPSSPPFSVNYSEIKKAQLLKVNQLPGASADSLQIHVPEE